MTHLWSCPVGHGENSWGLLGEAGLSAGKEVNYPKREGVIYSCSRLLCPKQKMDETGRTEFRGSGESRVDNVCLEPGSWVTLKKSSSRIRGSFLIQGSSAPALLAQALVQAIRELGMRVKGFTKETKTK